MDESQCDGANAAETERSVACLGNRRLSRAMSGIAARRCLAVGDQWPQRPRVEPAGLGSGKATSGGVEAPPGASLPPVCAGRRILAAYSAAARPAVSRPRIAAVASAITLRQQGPSPERADGAEAAAQAWHRRSLGDAGLGRLRWHRRRAEQ